MPSEAHTHVPKHSYSCTGLPVLKITWASERPTNEHVRKAGRVIKREEGYEFIFYLEPHENQYHLLAFISTYTGNIDIQSLNVENHV